MSQVTGHKADFSYDPYSKEAMSDPLPLYKYLRDNYSAYRIEKYEAWALPRFQDVWEVTADAERFSVVDGVVLPPDLLHAYPGPPPSPSTNPIESFVKMDPPIHTQLRSAAVGPLRPRPVVELEEQIRNMARARLDELVPHGRFDVVTEYAGRVSAGVMCLIIGLPAEQPPKVLELVNQALRRDEGAPGVTAKGEEARNELIDMLASVVRRRRVQGAGGEYGMVDSLINAEVGNRALTDREIADQAGSIIVGGSETVPKVVARGLYELHQRPDQLEQVLSDLPNNCRLLFEEVIRYGGPLQWVARTLKVDSVVADTAMKAGERILLLIASANRDEREFDLPDDFIWNRQMNRHFAFGHATHFCIGVHVARLEGRILLEELLDRVPNYDLDVAASQMPASEFQLGYTSMPLIVG